MSESYDQTVVRLQTFAKEVAPYADLAPGSVLSELIIKLSATLQNPVKAETDALNQANSIKDVINSTEDTYSEIIDEVASNYNVVRNEGNKSTGQVKVYVKELKPSYLEPNFSFVQPAINTTYVVTQAWTVTTKTDPDELLPDELLIKHEGDLLYFVVPVIATDVGPQYQLQNETVLELGPNMKLNNYDTVNGSKTYGAFSSGKARETDKELVARFQSGLSVRNLTSPNAINAVLRARWPSIKTISVIGANDYSLSRSMHNPFGIAIPGKADVYVRTTEGLETSQFTMPGIPVSLVNGVYVLTPGSPLWMVDINWVTSDTFDAYGFYKIASVEKAGTTSYGTATIHDTIYGFDLGPDNSNDVTDITEARFTKYQTCKLIFEHQEITSVESADFVVTVTYQPYIKDIQNLFTVDEERIACSDYLVKAVVPCLVSMSLTLVPKTGVTLDLNLIKQAIFSYVNNIPLGESLYASKIVDICHNYDVKHVILPIKMNGEILKPSASQSDIVSITSTDTLTIPDTEELVALGVSQKNTAFFAEYGTTGDSIQIQLV